MMTRRTAGESIRSVSDPPGRRDEWLGAEAQVRFRGRTRDRRSFLRDRPQGFHWLAVALAALAGAFVASLLVPAAQGRGGRRGSRG